MKGTYILRLSNLCFSYGTPLITGKKINNPETNKCYNYQQGVRNEALILIACLS